MRYPTLFLFLTLSACSGVAIQPGQQGQFGEAGEYGEPGEPHGPTNSGGYEQWRLDRWRDENGNLPTAADWAAARATAGANADYWDAFDDLQRTDWIERGPDNIGGRTRSLLIHPEKPWRMWAGSVSGGIWRSDTYGRSWESVDDFMGNLAIGCLTLDPSNHDVIYAGTGEAFGNADAVTGAGIWKSSDGGVHWSLMAGTAGFGNVLSIAVKPNDSNTILAATTTGLRRTTDGGANWATPISGSCQQVLFDPTDPNNCIAPVTTSGNTRQLRVSSSAGNSFGIVNVLGTGTGRVVLAYAPATSGRVYASLERNGGELWRSDTWGFTWTQLAAAGLTGVGAQTGYNNCVWVDPTNSNHIVVGYSRLRRSTDGGATFSIIATLGHTDSDNPHADCHWLAADPRYDGVNNKTLYVCTDGGVYRAADITTASVNGGWSQRENEYRTLQIYGIAGHGSGRIVCGAQDNGTCSITLGDRRGEHMIAADGGPCAIVPEDPRMVFAQQQNGAVFRLIDGQPWQYFFDIPGARFVAPLMLDPHDSGRLFGGGQALWLSTNAKTAPNPTWTTVKPAMASPISAMAIAPTDQDIMWVAHDSGQLYRTANATAAAPTWVAVDDNATADPLPNRGITDIVISHGDPNTVLVTLGGFSAGNVQRTTNNGATFAAVQGSGAGVLPNAPANGIAQHPLLPDHFYVTTEVGLFETVDDGVTWSTQHVGPADVACGPIDFIPGTTTLLLGSYGRGAWTAELPVPGAVSFGDGCAGTFGVAAMNASAPRVGQPMTIQGNRFPPFAPLWIVQGSSRHEWFGNILPYDLAPFGAAGCMLHVRPDIVREATANGLGQLLTTIPIFNSPALIGQQFYLQLFGVDLQANGWGRVSSNAFHLTVGP